MVTHWKAWRRLNTAPLSVSSFYYTDYAYVQVLMQYITGFYYVTLALLTFVYMICSLRTNICLFLALFLLVITFGLFAGTYFQTALGNLVLAAKLQKVCSNYPIIPDWIRTDLCTNRRLVRSTSHCVFRFGIFSLRRYSMR